MAGNLKPNIINLGEEVIPRNVVGIGHYNSTADNLFDGINSSEGNPMEHAFYWSSDISQSDYYLQFTIDHEVNIWRNPSISYPQVYLQQNCLKILKLKEDGSNVFEDVTSLYPQTVSVYSHEEWEKTICNLPKGTYRFISTGYRIDGEWYLERVFTSKYLIQTPTNILQTITDGVLTNLADTAATEELFNTQGFDDVLLINGVSIEPESKILVWTDNTSATKVSLEYEIPATNLLNSDYKLLMYTDNTDIVNVTLNYNCDEYRPIDKADDQFKILMYKEE